MAYGYVTPDGGWTIEYWSWREATSANWSMVFFQFTQASSATWDIGLNSYGRQIGIGYEPTTSALHIQLTNKDGTDILTWTDPSPSGYPDDDTWHHFAFVMSASDKRTVKVYLDGDLYATQVASVAFDIDPGIMTIAGGAWAAQLGQYGQWYPYDQRLAYFAIKDQELSAARIEDHYTSGSGGTVYYGDNEQVRLNRIYEWVGVPEWARSFEAPLTTLQGIKVAETNALEAVQTAADSALGQVFADGQSVLRYYNRKHRYNRWTALTVSETTGSAPEIGMRFSTSSSKIYNDIRGNRPFGSLVRMQNEESQSAHGQKVYTFTLATTDHLLLQNAVAWILSTYGDSMLRVTGVEFRVESSYLAREIAYGRVDIGDVLVIDELPDPAPEIRMEYMIEGIGVDIDFMDRQWVVSLHLSPHSVNQVFQIGVTPLTTGARLAL